VSEPQSNRFADPILWLAVLAFAVLLYLFAYPVVFMLFVVSAGIEPESFAGNLVYPTVAPLNWLYENVAPYESYLDFISNLFH